MSDEAEKELREIREKMERGELNPRARPEPTPDDSRWAKLWDELKAAADNDRWFWDTTEKAKAKLAADTYRHIHGEPGENRHYLDHLWAVWLIEDAGCRPPESR